MAAGAYGQRINATISAGWMLGKTNATVFDNTPFQFLYAAPYATPATSSYDQVSPYDQVRLVEIYGASPFSRKNFSFSGGLQYQALNNWRFGIDISTFRDQDDIYYRFQNMVINGSADQNSIDLYSPELLDDYISIAKWIGMYGIDASYEVKTKSKIKPEILLGYRYKVQLFSTYDSELLANQNTYLNGDNADYVKEYYNTKVFQDKLYQELSSDGFNHYIKLGLGARLYSGHVQFEWLRSLGDSKGEYYIVQNIFNLKISYDLISIPLFK